MKVLFALVLTLLLAAGGPASAQECGGCNVNILGEDVVHVGDTKIYFVTPNHPNIPYTQFWDSYGYLAPFASIIDQGKTANGIEWVMVGFSQPGDVWLTYDGLYPGMTQDFGELYIRIEP